MKGLDNIEVLAWKCSSGPRVQVIHATGNKSCYICKQCQEEDALHLMRRLQRGGLSFALARVPLPHVSQQ